jgi:membrane-bound lytic murein transglycosylase D
VIPEEHEVPGGLELLHEKILDARRDYERGLELLVAGEEVLGGNMLAAASNRLTVYAEECSRLGDCDMGLFSGALEILATGVRPPETARTASLTAWPERAEAGEEGAGESPFVGALPGLERTVSLVEGVDLRELITINGPIRAALHDWLTWNRAELVRAYENYQFLRHKMAPAYERAGLPEALLFAVMAKESGGKVHAYSRMGAAGPLQFMRHTGRRYGLRTEDGFDMRLDPQAASEASVAYLSDQLETFNNDLEKVLIAYNAGESRMRRLNRKLDGASFWEPELYYALPRETREYVPQVLAAAWLFLHPEDYGLAFPVYETNSTRIVLKEAITLDELTICLGSEHGRDGWYRALRNLNPRYRSHERIPAASEIELPSLLVPVYTERCVGDAPLLARARELHRASASDEGVPRR